MANTAPSKVRVFLSYARADDAGSARAAYDDPARSFMRRLYNALKDEFDVWWDMESMPSRGEAFTKEIEEAINAHDRFVLVVAPHALKSDYVRAEWTHALARCIPITPILRSGNYESIPAELKAFHGPYFMDPRPFEQACDELRQKLRAEPGRLAVLHNFRRELPQGHISREKTFQQAREALLRDDITATVVSTPSPNATAIYGQGGLGKSTLATALALDCGIRRRYPDGILWVEITQTPSIEARLGDIGAFFGDARENYVGPGKDVGSATARLSQVLRDKRALIILDDVWKHEVVHHFRVAYSPCRLLITTRSGALAGTIDGEDVRLDRLSDAEGAALIAARAGGSAQDPIYKSISEALGGHTLAVTLAAARLKKKGAGYAQTLLEGLNHPADPFANLNVDAEDKDLNLSRSLGQSYEALDADGQRRFRALGAFAIESTFDLSVLAAVWDESPDNADRTAETLVDASLLDAAEGGRYSQHRVLRTYARALMVMQGELDAAVGRLFNHYYLSYGPEHDHTDLNFVRTIETDADNVFKTLTWALDFRPEAGYAFLAALDNYMRVYLNTPLYRTLLETALTIAQRAGNLVWQANVLRALGDTNVRADEAKKAHDCYERAMLIFEKIGDLTGQANTLKSWGDLRVRLSELDTARSDYDRALVIFEQAGARLGQANTLHAMGILSTLKSDLIDARNFYIRALSLYDQICLPIGQANTLKSLGELSVHLSELGEARVYYDRALLVFLQIPDRLGQANTLLALGWLSIRLCDLDAAHAHYDNALNIFVQVNDSLGYANAELALGDLMMRVVDYSSAYKHFETALALYEAIPARLGQASTLKSLGDLAMWEADLPGARKHYAAALALFEAIPDRLGQANTLQSLGDLASMEADYPGARERYAAALALFEAIPDRLGQANTLKSLGDLASMEADTFRASKYFSQAMEIYQKIGDQVGQMNTLVRMARMARDQQVDAEAAKRHFEALFALADTIPAYRDHPDTEVWRQEYAALQSNSTLREEIVRKLATNTVVVKTSLPGKLEEWRSVLAAQRAEWGTRGADYAIEVAFADALLAILDDQPPAIAPDNPYADVVRQVVEAIASARGAG